jgi:hypothetical protein
VAETIPELVPSHAVVVAKVPVAFSIKISYSVIVSPLAVGTVQSILAFVETILVVATYI